VVRAVVYVSPPTRLVADALPPIKRYLKLLQVGARAWRLSEAYCTWLEKLPRCVQSAPLTASLGHWSGAHWASC
jgi:hypothetical protein